MVAAAHSESHQGPPGNGGRLFERSWGRRTASRPMGTWVDKPSQGAGRRPSAGNGYQSRCRTISSKTGQRGDHRLWRGVGCVARLRGRSGCRWDHRRGDGRRRHHRGRRRPGRRKTGHSGDHRLWRSAGRANTSAAAVGQRLRGASRRHRTGALSGPQRHGDLAGPGRYPRLHRRLPERQALRAQAGRRRVQRSLRRDPDRAW